jgi:hypothetical protein
MAHHEEQDLIATGQVGKDPPIHIWNLKTRETVAILKGIAEPAAACSLNAPALLPLPAARRCRLP